MALISSHDRMEFRNALVDIMEPGKWLRKGAAWSFGIIIDKIQ